MPLKTNLRLLKFSYSSPRKDSIVISIVLNRDVYEICVLKCTYALEAHYNAHKAFLPWLVYHAQIQSQFVEYVFNYFFRCLESCPEPPLPERKHKHSTLVQIPPTMYTLVVNQHLNLPPLQLMLYVQLCTETQYNSFLTYTDVFRIKSVLLALSSFGSTNAPS